jgi:hypothetical protein
MSKQVRLKFKKLLKKAEFVHADLEYHEELISEAKREFFAKVEEIINKLSPEDKKKINEAKKKRMAERIKQDGIKNATEEEDEVNGLPDNETMLCSEDVSDTEEDSEHDARGGPGIKSSTLKNLFHDIAELSHPDKTEARGLAPHEVKKLEKIFKAAQIAYKDGNWYLLYIIALDLDIEVEDPTEDHIEWVEEGVQDTLSKISQISNLVVWAWYGGNGLTKFLAIKNYFQQSFGFTL